MATSYSTPGVYIDEINSFPPSVAPVETAIPAFIGFTQTATNLSTGDLLNVPTRITSMQDYEMYFGYGPSYTNLTVYLDNNNNPIISSPPSSSSDVVGSNEIRFYLYNSLRLFFDNGGGPCYIVSIGTGYTQTLSSLNAEDFIGDTTGYGLATLTKYDEPTLLLFPDAVNLPPVDLASVQQAALMQCGNITNRFCILDLCRVDKVATDFGSGENINTPFTGSIDTFRSNVGMNNLDMGAAYHSWIETTYAPTFTFSDVNGGLIANGVSTNFQEIVGPLSPLYGPIGSYITLTGTDIPNVSSQLATAANLALSNNIAAHSPTLGASSFISYFSNAHPSSELGLYVILQNIDNLLVSAMAGSIQNSNYLTSATTFVASTVRPILVNLVNVDSALTSSPPDTWMTGYTSMQYSLYTYASTALGGTITPAALSGPYSVNTQALAVQSLQLLATQLANAQQTLINMGNTIATSLGTSLANQIPGYSNIINMLTSIANTMPPSGAIAGVYAATDNSRGVWKAPANVSLNSVAAVDTYIDDAMQENMNIDPNAGKSINAIRSFHGKGILVWGSRTLAGNDNNWRYVPVRRFTSFVEESCKLSTSWAVFEPNDANLWMKVRSEIENFLYTQWSAGALAGAKPSDAYYVQCGLGTTMNAQDILNGYLKVLIGMAVVRPAEFIILEFTQILQVS